MKGSILSIGEFLFAIIAIGAIMLVFSGDAIGDITLAASPGEDLREIHQRVAEGGVIVHQASTTKYLAITPKAGPGRGSVAFIYVPDPNGRVESFVSNKKILATGCEENCLCTGRLYPYGDVRLAALVDCEDMSEGGVERVKLVGDINNYWGEACRGTGGNNWAVPMCVLDVHDFPNIVNITLVISQCDTDCVQYNFTWGLK